jgi:enoyl-CoA hydratase/carnithine racemase
MTSLRLDQDGSVYVLTLCNGARANGLSDPVLLEWAKVLDELEAEKGNTALVVTSDDPKVWCNGIDLDWLRDQPPEGFDAFKRRLDKMFARVGLLSMPTVGCLTGHAFGGGAILACALDFRFMRLDRGFFCFPEVDLGIPFSDLMHRVIEGIPDRGSLHELALTGRRVGGEEATRLRVVQAAYSEAELFPKVLDFARVLAGKDRRTYTAIKRGLKADLVQAAKGVLGD